MKALTSLKSEWVVIEWNFLLQCWLDSLAEAPEMCSPQKLSATLLCSLWVLHSWIYKTSTAEKSFYADFGMVDLTFIQSHSGPFMLKLEPLGKHPFSVCSTCLVVKEGLKVISLYGSITRRKHLLSKPAIPSKGCWKSLLPVLKSSS